MKMIELTWILGLERPQTVAPATASEVEVEAEGEDDGIVSLPEEQAPAPVAEGERLIISPIALDASQVRTFYPRKGGAPGTRVILRGGTAYPVKESFEEVKAAIKAAMAA